MKTYLPKVDSIERNWYVVDAADKVLGRLAVHIANVLRGRNKPTYTPHLDTGDFIVVVNAEKVKLTGRKETRKVYDRYTGYMGGRKQMVAQEVRQRHPTFLIEHAVWGMMPHNRLGRSQFKKLNIYAGPEHPHEAQCPSPLES